MRIESIRAITGPNIYTYRPVMVMRLDLEELAGKETSEFPGFVARILRKLPGLREHGCSERRRGGLVDRMRAGTYFGHVIEHAALELSVLAGMPASFGKTVATEELSVYEVIVEFRSREGMEYLLESAVHLIEDMLLNRRVSLVEQLKRVKEIADNAKLGISTQAIVEAAERRGIPWVRLNRGSMIRFGYGKYQRVIEGPLTNRTPSLAVDLASDKETTKKLLKEAAIPVPEGRRVKTVEGALDAFDELGPPVVLKPADGHQGQGVSLNLETPEQVAEAFKQAKKHSWAVLVERFLKGKDYRALVVNGRLVAASERMPAHVVGDGQRTVLELVRLLNMDPRRGSGHEKPMSKVLIDKIALALLKKAGLRLDSVPLQGQVVLLRGCANLSTGGTAKDVTDQVHPEVKFMCERAARAIGLDVCGVDMILEDIRLPVGRTGGVVEVNASPGLRMHECPTEGRPRKTGEAIVEMLYPRGSPSRIPIIAVTGTNGKTTVTRMVRQVVLQAGQLAGMTTTEGIFIGPYRVAAGDLTGPKSAMTVLSDPAVEVAVLETARGGIARCGLAFDWCDIAVMTNIQSDHIGQDGIRSIDDLIHIKSLVAERVRAGGTVVLNADDPRLSRLMERERMHNVPKQTVYFSLFPNNPVIRRHRAEGGLCFINKRGWILECSGNRETPVLLSDEVPVTLHGAAEFHVSNVAAAVAACRVYGIGAETIRAALRKFGPDNNPGRTNLYGMNGGYVVVDYGHNPEAIKAVQGMAVRWGVSKVTAVVGVPGDRADSLIEESAKTAASGFDELIIKEDHDLRGRKSGEVARLLLNSVQRHHPGLPCRVILDEGKAIETALRQMKKGELVALFYEKLDPVREILQKNGAVPLVEAEPGKSNGHHHVYSVTRR